MAHVQPGFILSFFILVVASASAIAWLGLGVGPAVQWSSSRACWRAKRDRLLTSGQARLCRSHPAALVQVALAASSAVLTCQDLLTDHRWNCSSITRAPGFAPDLTMGTREQALVYALGSAALTHRLARGCTSGQLGGLCSCGAARARPAGHFKWGGCSDNLRWAAKFARRFLDAAARQRLGHQYRERMRTDSKNDRLTALVNKHNNRVGQRVLSGGERTRCKCHGMSGSCSVRTCWRALPSHFADTAASLLRLYPAAVQEYGHQVIGSWEATNDQLAGFHYSRNDLLFLASSPDYCRRDDRVGSVGTYKRKCNMTREGLGGCGSMCCGRGYVTRKEERVDRCHCQYHWCCYVHCKTCQYTEPVSYCH